MRRLPLRELEACIWTRANRTCRSEGGGCCREGCMQGLCYEAP